MAPFLRIVAQVIAGILIGKGWFSEETVESIFSDPALDMAIGAVIWGTVELFYYLAKKFGWKT